MRVRAQYLFAAVLLLAVAGCVPNSSGGSAAPLPTASSEARWPVRSVAHIDLWLHTFAMLDADSAPVPLFRRGYRDSAIVARNAVGARPPLDTLASTLAARYRSTPLLQGAQFLAFQFRSWTEMQAALQFFLKAQGNPQNAGDQQTAQMIAALAQQFPTAADRTWLEQFVIAVEGERRQFFEAWWTQVQRTRAPVIDAVDLLWQGTYRAKFDRLLNATNQRFGSFVLSLPLGAEGRASGTSADGRPMIAVPLPGRSEDAREAILVFAHEIVGTIAASAVNDNTTPAEKRTGAADRLVATGQVEAGRSLLQRAAPELEAPYIRYYLAQGGHGAPRSGDLGAMRRQLAAAYPAPELIRDAIARQLDIVLGGI